MANSKDDCGSAHEGATGTYLIQSIEFFQPERDMISAEEQQILASLSEVSQDIRSHLTLIGELTAQKDKAARVVQQSSQILHKP